MFNKEEKKALIHRFWSQFDEYCETIPDLAWRKKKWLLHDTKIGHLVLKFDVRKDFAMVAIEINHKSENRRFQVYELIEKYRMILSQGFEKGLTWDFCYLNDIGQEVCRIYIEKGEVDIHHIREWGSIYQFLAENMLQLQDNFIEIQEVLKEEINQLYREM